MTAPLRQPTGDRHQIGGVEWRLVARQWLACAHGHLLVTWVGPISGEAFRGEWRGSAYPEGVAAAKSLAHAMRNAAAWARRNPANKPSARRARAVFEALVGRAG